MNNACRRFSILMSGGLACVAAVGLSTRDAAAQGSVTLYGIVDAGVTWVSNAGGAKQVKFDDGISYFNRLGFKGDEDLGNGLHAVFTLESGFSLGSGRFYGGDGFGRLAFVGLKSEQGTLTFGNQADMANEFVYLYDIPSWGSGYAIGMGDFARMEGDHLTNAVKYLSPDIHGLTFGGMYAFGNVAGNFHQESGWSVGGRYTHGAFNAGAAYTVLNNPSGSYAFDPYAMLGTDTFLGQPVAARASGGGAPTDLYASTPFPVDRQATLGVGAAYTIDKLTLSGDFTYTGIKAFGKTSYMREFQGGAGYNFTPALILYGGVQHTRFEGHHWNQASLGLHYLLSARTDVYLSGDYLRASSGVDAVIGYSFTPSSTQTQADVRIGMRHSF